MRRSAIPLVAFAAATMFVGGSAFAAITTLTIDDTAKLDGNGRNAKIVVRAVCDDKSHLRLTATITQGTLTPTVGRVSGQCRPTLRDFKITVVSKGERFQPGPAEACVEAAEQTKGGGVTDQASTCEPVQLGGKVKEPKKKK